MIDNPADAMDLLDQLHAALPVAARLTPELRASLASKNVGAPVPPGGAVIALHYMGDEGGIVCRLNLGAAMQNEAFVSITHLRFDPRLPLARKSATYQNTGSNAFAARAPDPRTFQPVNPTTPCWRHDAYLEEARATLDRQISCFLDRALGWHMCKGERSPEHAALSVEVGVGKSFSARSQLPKFISHARSRGLPHRVLWLVPHHRLSIEAMNEMAALGLKVAIWRGRDADDPSSGGLKMCLNEEGVRDARAIHADVESTICGTEKGPRCQFFNSCGYQRQKLAAFSADVLILAHQMLFRDPPASKGTGLVVVDESFWQAGLVERRMLNITGLAADVIRYPILRVEGDTKAPDGEATRRHQLVWRMVERLAKSKAVGECITREDLQAHRITPRLLEHSVEDEWARKVPVPLVPGMSASERQRAIAEVAVNARVSRRAAFLRILKALLESTGEQTARIKIDEDSTPSGISKVITFSPPLSISKIIYELPVLILDATLPESIVRSLLPDLIVLSDIRCTAPNQRIVQVAGGWGKSSLMPSAKTSPQESSRRRRTVELLRDFVRMNSMGNALVVTYQGLEAEFRDIPGVETAHFNAIAGLDAFRSVRALFVIGRPQSQASDVRKLATTIFGCAASDEEPALCEFGALMSDGTGKPLNSRIFCDPHLEAIRSAITDAQVVQAIGRARGVSRDALNPVQIFVFSDVVLPFCVEELTEWRDLLPGPIERMAARGIIFESPTDAARAFPELFPSADAAKKAFGARGQGKSPIEIPYREKSPTSPYSAVEYQPAGMGQRPRVVHVRPDLLDEFREWLEGILGPLVRCSPINLSLGERPELAGSACATAEHSTIEWVSPPPAEDAASVRTLHLS